MNTDKIKRAVYIVNVFENCKEYFINKKNNAKDLADYREAEAYLDTLASRI